MTDIVEPDVRSRMMASVRSKDTKHEVKIRKSLHAVGFRYRIHRRDLPGTPDITFPRYRAIVFVHGCFWHGHSCYLFKWPSTNREKWMEKIKGNRTRDAKAVHALSATEWRVCIIWECAMRGVNRHALEDVVERVSRWILSKSKLCEIEGRKDVSRPSS